MNSNQTRTEATPQSLPKKKSSKEKGGYFSDEGRDGRKVRCTLILGTNGTGKSTTCSNIIKAAGRKTLVVDYEGRERMWRGIPELTTKGEIERFGHYLYNRDPNPKAKKGPWVAKVLYGRHDLDTLRWIFQHFRDGLVVFDDCRMYLPTRELPELKHLLIRRRQNMTDMIFVGHGFTEIPVRVFTFTDDIILFRTTDSVKRLADRFRDPHLVIESQERVNKTAIETRNAHYVEHVVFP